MIIKFYLVLFTSNDADKCLCRKIYNEHHCIHDLLPPLHASINYLRPKGHSFECRCEMLSTSKYWRPEHNLHIVPHSSVDCLILSPVLHKNICYLDVCLHMCSSAIRYVWFCMSICISIVPFCDFCRLISFKVTDICTNRKLIYDFLSKR